MIHKACSRGSFLCYIYLFICLSVYLPVDILVCLSNNLLSIYLSIYLSRDQSEISSCPLFCSECSLVVGNASKYNILHAFYPGRWQWETGCGLSTERLIIKLSGLKYLLKNYSFVKLFFFKILGYVSFFMDMSCLIESRMFRGGNQFFQYQISNLS